MENASRALLIAGAVLIAIAVIVVGIIIANKGKSTLEEIGDITIDNAKRAAQVSKFGKYEGEVVGTEVEQCIYEAIAYNAGLAKNGGYLENLPYAIGVSVTLPTSSFFIVNRNNYNENGGRVSWGFSSRISDIKDYMRYNCILRFDNNTGTLIRVDFEVL